MITLPIFLNKKRINLIFKILKNDDTIIITPFDEINKLLDVCCFNKNGIMKKKIFFPLQLKIIDKNLYSEYFFYTSQIEGIEFDFFKLLLLNINNTYNTNYKYVNIFNLNTISNIYNTYQIKYETNNSFSNTEQFLRYTYNKIIYNQNFILLLIYNIYNIKLNLFLYLNKKKNQIIKNIFNLKIFYNGKEDTINNLIEYFGYDNILNILLILYDKNIFDLICDKIYKNNHYNSLIKYYSENNEDYLIFLKLLKVNILNISDKYKFYFSEKLDITHDNISFELFKKIVNKDKVFNSNLLQKLLEKFNENSTIFLKNKLDNKIKKIIYYFYKFRNDIKILKDNNFFINYIFLIIKNIDNIDILNDSKIYSKLINYNIIKIIIFKNNILDIEVNKIINKFNYNLVVYNISTKLEWMYINEQIDYMDYYLNYVDDNLFLNNIQFKIKKIILKPYLMFNYFENEFSFIKWLYIINKYINQIFYQTIKIKKKNLYCLGQILYYLSIIDKNNLEDKNYEKLINLIYKYKVFVIFDNKINIKINDIFYDKNINLGILLKDIKNVNININLDDNSNKLIKKINKYKIKYFKYKGKYLLSNLI